MAKASGVHAGTVLKWAFIVAVVYVGYRLLASWTTAATASLSGAGSTVAGGGYASPGGYTSAASDVLPVAGYGFNPLPSIGGTLAPGLGPLPLPIVSKPFNGRLI